MTSKRHLVNANLNNSWSLTLFPVFTAFLYWPRSLLPTGYLISVLYTHSCRCRKRILLFRCLPGSDSEYQQVKLFSGSSFSQMSIWDLGLHHPLQFGLITGLELQCLLPFCACRCSHFSLLCWCCCMKETLWPCHLPTVHTGLQVAQTSPVQTCLHWKMRAKEGGVFKMEIVILKYSAFVFEQIITVKCCLKSSLK